MRGFITEIGVPLLSRVLMSGDRPVAASAVNPAWPAKPTGGDGERFPGQGAGNRPAAPASGRVSGAAAADLAAPGGFGGFELWDPSKMMVPTVLPVGRRPRWLVPVLLVGGGLALGALLGGR